MSGDLLLQNCFSWTEFITLGIYEASPYLGKSDRLLTISLTLVGAFTLSNCATNTRQNRIAKNQDIFTQLTRDHQVLVQQGQIKKGMDKKAVYLAWGDPSRSSKGSDNGTSFEKWYYYLYSPTYSGSFYGGYGHRGHYGTSIARSNDYISELESKVEFRKGRVYKWENAR